VVVAGGFVRETECGAHSLQSAQKVKLLLHAESEACSRAEFLHVDLLEPDALKAGAFKRPETDTQKYRHDINRKLVDESCIQELLRYADGRRPLELSYRGRQAAFAWAIADSIPSVTNLKVRCSSCFGATLGG
jgi:hypothetical protein